MRYQNVQALRAIAATLVIFVHIAGPDGFTASAFSGFDPFAWLYSLGNAGVDIFFAVSGFIMLITTRKLEHNPKNAARFLLRRVIRIYPPYILVTLALFAARAVVPSEAPDSGIISSLLLLPHSNLPVLFVGWTLIYEMYFYLVFTVSLLVRRKLQWIVFAAWAVVILGLGAILLPTDNAFVSVALGALNIEFLLGMLVGIAVVERNFILPATSTIVGAAGILATYFVVLTPGQNIENAWYRVALVGVPAAILLYGANALEARDRRAPKWLAGYGDASYALYLTHVPTLMALGLLARRLPDSPVAAVAASILAIAACIAVSLVFRRWVEVPLLNGLERLLKARPRRPHVASEVAP